MGRRALSVAERACLLRAARASLREMELELDRLHRLIGMGLAGAVETAIVIQVQYECLTSAVRWLWQQREK